MAGKIYSGTYVNGITLKNPSTEVPATITALGYVTNNSTNNGGTALFGDAKTAWTITNFGRIEGGGADTSDGIRLLAGGFVTNGASGSAAGLITGKRNGVEIDGAIGTVVNFGAIVGLGTLGNGVDLLAGGSVHNGGLIEGGANGVAIAGGTGTVTNAGTIVSTVGAGVLLASGGSLSNTGEIESGAFGVETMGRRSATVTNAGVIADAGSTGAGIYLQGGGSILNEQGGRITAARTDAVRVERGRADVVNFGTIIGGSPSSGAAIYLGGGGVVRNGESGKAFGLISGKRRGVVLNNAVGSVDNFGTIESTSKVRGNSGLEGVGVLLGAGGTVSNGDSGKGGKRALISAKEIGVYIGGIDGKPRSGAVGTVVNWGTIRSTGVGAIGSPAVLLVAGGTVVNHREIDSGGGTAVTFLNKLGTVTNFGWIDSRSRGPFGVGVYLQNGGVVRNQEGAQIAALRGDGVVIAKGAGTVVNFGTIEGGSQSAAAAVYLGHGGLVMNGRNGTAGALIDGLRAGVVLQNLGGKVDNFGTIESTSTIVGSSSMRTAGVLLGAGGAVVNGGLIESAGGAGVSVTGRPGTVTNSGTIVSRGSGPRGVGVYLQDGGRVANDAGNIAAPYTAVEIERRRGVVGNLGTIASVNGAALYLGGGGAVTNGRLGSSSGLIRSKNGDGVALANAAGRVTNFGTILSLRSAAVQSSAGGDVTNRGLIKGADGSGIAFDNKAGTVTNFGSVVSTPKSDAGAAIYLQDGGVVINERGGFVKSGLNAGILSRHGVATIVNFGTIESRSENGVYLAAGGTLINKARGVIAGGVHGVYIMNPSGTVINHGTIDGGSAGFVTFGAGTETLINFGTIGNTAGTAGVAVEIDGSEGGNVLVVEPHAVFVGSVLGGGKSEIEFVGGGTADMNGVDGFATIRLLDRVSHKLTLTNANFSDVTGGIITVLDGDKGNRVSAAGVSSAFAIIVDVGSGGDTLTGGAGTNEFVFSAPGHNRITNFGFSPTNELVFSNSGFDLGLKNASSTPQLLPSRLLAVNKTGSFTNTQQRFAYDTKDGDLFYSATGTTANEHLVVALTGAPPLTLTPFSHLFYVS